MKKFINVLMTVFLVFIFAFTGCGGKDADAGEKDTTVIVSADNVQEILFERVQNSKISCFQSVKIKLKKGYEKAVLSSDNSEIVAIENGFIVGISTGSAVLSAVFDGIKQEQIITVVKPETVDFDLDNLPILKGDSYKISLTTYVDNIIVGDVEYYYETKNPSVATINGDVLSGMDYGSTEVVVTVSWHGTQITKKSIPCTVNSNDAIYTNKESYEIYTIGNVLGTPFKTSETIVAYVFSDGAKVEEATLLWASADTSVATVSGSGVISAVSEGETVVTGACNYGGKTISTRRIPVKVSKPYLSTDVDVLFDVNESTGVFDTAKVLGSGYSIGKIVDIDNKREYETTDNSVNMRNFPIGEYRLAVYEANEEFATEINVVVADFIINDVNDLQSIHWGSYKYVALNADLENVGKYNNLVPDGQEHFFTGTFNGLGHKISGIRFQFNNFGLIRTLDGATIKNLAVVCSAEGKRQGALFYNCINHPVIDNVYIDMTFAASSENVGGISHLVFGEITVRNCFVKSHGTEGRYNGAAVAVCNTNGIRFINTYFVSDVAICSDDPNYTYNAQYALLRSQTSGIVFDTDEEFTVARAEGLVSLEGYNSYWDLSGSPIFKTVI
ncbi:MAG: hypothetical protein J5697_00635 [Clostridia bacterium]|nr:hypothetical protein [Clostridia bacterium]